MRLRKKSEHAEDPPQHGTHKTETKPKRSRFFQQTLTRLAVGIFGLVTLVKFYPDNLISVKTVQVVDHAVHASGFSVPAYAVVIDAGSTGSRVLAFTFHRNAVTGDLVLDDELWVEDKRGLSSYAGEAREGGASINRLLDRAKERIPGEFWKDTPVTLKATAGLRLLPKDDQEELIGEVVNVLGSSGFKVVDGEGGVEIMSELNEGVFGWFMVNFLLDKLNHLEESYVALDLGGGSTQITFVPGDKSKKNSPPDYLHDTQVKKDTVAIYSHSYLGLGLMAAKKQIFTSTSGDSSPTSFTSPCFISSTPSTWVYQKTNFTVSRASSQAGYETCLAVVEAVIKKAGVHKPVDLSKRNIAVFSYFFDRAVDSGLLSPTGFGGVVEVGDFVEAAKKTCKGNKLFLNSPLLCTDLTYIAALLTKGYNLDHSVKLNVFKKIHGHEASWALGAGYSLLN